MKQHYCTREQRITWWSNISGGSGYCHGCHGWHSFAF